MHDISHMEALYFVIIIVTVIVIIIIILYMEAGSIHIGVVGF